MGVTGGEGFCTSARHCNFKQESVNFIRKRMLLQLNPSSSSFIFSSKTIKTRTIFPFSLLPNNPLLSSFPLTHHFKPPQISSIPTHHSCIHNKATKSKFSEDLNIVAGNKLLSELSTWGIGGPCNLFVQVFNRTQLISAIRYCEENCIEFLIIGKGSNCLFDDDGFNGCVILNRIEFLEKDEMGVYRVGSGYPFNRLGVQCCNDGFSGLEFAGGVPGTVGGAVYMNAGANGQETGDTVESVEIVTINGTCKILNKNDLAFGYRSSSFQNMEGLAAITAATFRLTTSPLSRQKQQEYLARRKVSQPLGERSAGSVFRNPASLGVSAAELIENAGLKGFKVGGAKVSEIHANFFINSGGSTSRDMLELIQFVKDKVNQKFGIELKEEIRYVHP